MWYLIDLWNKRDTLFHLKNVMSYHIKAGYEKTLKEQG